jgi:hypothetical protein
MGNISGNFKLLKIHKHLSIKQEEVGELLEYYK